MILEGSIRLPFSYAAGVTGSRFLVALRDEQRILGAVCIRCARVACPPRSYCVTCRGSTKDLIEVGPAGNVETWTEIPGKGVFGMIRLEGANTPLLHKLLGSPDRWEPGARVIARFRDQRTAEINDIEGFEQDRGAP